MSPNLRDFLVIVAILISPLILSKLLTQIFKINEEKALFLSFTLLMIPILLIFGLEGALVEAATLLFLGFLAGLRLLRWLNH